MTGKFILTLSLTKDFHNDILLELNQSSVANDISVASVISILRTNTKYWILVNHFRSLFQLQNSTKYNIHNSIISAKAITEHLMIALTPPCVTQPNDVQCFHNCMTSKVLPLLPLDTLKCHQPF